MKVILKQDIKGKGKKGQMIEAAEGYARNFLIPKGMAVDRRQGRRGRQAVWRHHRRRHRRCPSGPARPDHRRQEAGAGPAHQELRQL